MHPTRNDLPQAARAELAGLLNRHLAIALDLSMQCKQAHWNVKGPSFQSLHELFDSLAANAQNDADELAERCVALGGTAEGTVHVAARVSHLKPYPLDAVAGMDHVKALADAHATYGKSLREAIGKADQLEDADTADLFTELSRQADKNLWFLEAHLQAER